MEAAAIEAGFGDLNLPSRLIEYQRFGLMGRPLTKAARRGGEGLWHPDQLSLFLDVLHLREREKLRMPTIANVPVGLWRLGAEGISTEQAQRAMAHWGGALPGAPSGAGQPGHNRKTGRERSATRPRGDRSIRHKAIDQAVEWLSAPGASEQAKRELRHLLVVINDTGTPASPDTWARVALGVIAPDGEPSLEQRRAAHSMSIGFALQELAIRHLDQLCAQWSQPLWNWARAVDQDNRQGYLDEQARMVSDPKVGHLYSRPLIDDIVQQGCRGQLTILGMTLAILWGEFGMQVPPGEEPPPRVKVVRRM
jgi:hypothetical protein